MIEQSLPDQEELANIASNLKYIEDNCLTDDQLNELNEVTSNIAGNLKIINDQCPTDTELETLNDLTNNIADNLRAISDDETNLDELDQQLDRILAKLTEVRSKES